MQEGVGDVALAAAAATHPAAPQRRHSNVHLRSNSLAGDLHTSEHTKKDVKEVKSTLHNCRSALCSVIAPMCTSNVAVVNAAINALIVLTSWIAAF